jgi:pimeloyl-ACP methyl ester carboxylesterase
MLVNVGCHTDAHEQAKWFGDDIAVKALKFEHEPGMRAAAAGMHVAQGEGHWRRVIAQTFPRITQPTGYTFDDLARITAPTLILVGDRDPFCSLEEAATADPTLTAGELAVLPNTGHGITLEAVQTAVAFLERNAMPDAT